MPSMLPFGNCRGMVAVLLTLSPAAVAANTIAEQIFTLPGVLLGDFLEIQKPTTQVGLGIGNVRVSSTDHVAIAFINATAASITPTVNEVYQVLVIRPDTVEVNRATF